MPGPYTLAELVARFGGELLGDPAVRIRQVGTLENAQPDEISFLANPRYRGKLAAARAAAVILAPEHRDLAACARIVSDNPYAYFARVARFLNPESARAPGIDRGARVSPRARVAANARIEFGAVVEDDAEIGEAAVIGAGCVIGERARIGRGSRLYPSVSVYAGCIIGERAVIHSGAVIGADGFGIAKDGEYWVKVPQIGAVRIGDDAEIGANTCIDRGAIEDTVIGEGVKLDNHIQVGHNVRIGRHTAIAGCVGIAGSAEIGSQCRIGAGALILGHLKIADGVQVSAATVISRSILKPGVYTGLFPFDTHAAWTRNAVLIRHLGDMAERLRAVEQKLENMGRADG